MEVQIRTHAMHRIAEEGNAAHWRYKGHGRVTPEDAQGFTWLRHLLEWQQTTDDPQEFMYSVKDDLFSEEVFVFTPKGEILTFPEGSTVVDFAYRIHSEVGQHCSGARVNGRLVPLRYQLRNEDSVEIITTAHSAPTKEWLTFVKTSRAKQRIRNWIKHQQRTRSLAVGREILDRDLGRYGLSLNALRKQNHLAQLLSDLSQKDEETLLASIGYGKITSHQVLGADQVAAAGAAAETA
jgi:GTP pyrophosphokinase